VRAGEYANSLPRAGPQAAPGTTASPPRTARPTGPPGQYTEKSGTRRQNHRSGQVCQRSPPAPPTSGRPVAV